MMYFQNIQALRGIASFLVLWAHLVTTNIDVTPDWMVYYGYYLFGPTGVDIFFVISGFVVTLSAFKDSNESFKIGLSIKFIAKRIIRIYPLYWIVLLFAFLISPYVSLSPEWLPKASLIELITLTNPTNYKVMVAWTLVYEMFFYLVLSILIFVGKRKFFYCLFLWFFSEIILISFISVHNKELVSYVPFNPQILQFMAGCLVAYILIKFNTEKYGKDILIFGIIMFIFMCYINVKLGSWESAYNRTLTLTLPAAMIVYGLALCEFDNTFKFPRIIKYLGDISFSLYLWHQLIFYSLSFLLKESIFYSISYWFFIYLLMLIPTIFVSHYSYLYIEIKLQSFLKRVIFN